jgi:hypothetical protein
LSQDYAKAVVRLREVGVEADRLAVGGFGLGVPLGLIQDRAEVDVRGGKVEAKPFPSSDVDFLVGPFHLSRARDHIDARSWLGFLGSPH